MTAYYELGGRGVIRIRETYVRDEVAPLLSANALGVVKLDLVLRGLAGRGGDAGVIDADITWDQLHDLVRPGDFYRDDKKLKRNWIGDKIERLEARGLVSRRLRPGARSRLEVLRDDRSGRPLDDPGEAGDSYVSFLGTAFQFGRMQSWGTPQLEAFLAAMVAERYARSDPANDLLHEGRALGGGVWFRPLSWFEDLDGLRPAQHVRIGFSTRTLRRGILLLKAEGLIDKRRIYEDPRNGRPFQTRTGRYVYVNGFDDMRPGSPAPSAWRLPAPPQDASSSEEP